MLFLSPNVNITVPLSVPSPNWDLKGIWYGFGTDLNKTSTISSKLQNLLS